jgi:hypothetical protein
MSVITIRVKRLLDEVAAAEFACDFDQIEAAVTNFIGDLEEIGVLNHDDYVTLFLRSIIRNETLSYEFGTSTRFDS